ncbi:MAG: sulfurtransferase TusA family protein [Gammaproteobacteria bacterium]
MKARNELRKFAVGDVIRFKLIDPDAAKQVSSSLEKDGHQILGIQDVFIEVSKSA